MASRLAALQGEAMYLDAHSLVGLIDAESEHHMAGASFFQRAVDPRHPMALCTATLILAEVICVLLHEMPHGTLPRDALHLAVMQRLGLTAMASDDEGCDHRQDVGLFQP
jgi:predicted nucleic acid-binding protein